jgi:N-acetylglucosamine-6-phosphate deacetylase
VQRPRFPGLLALTLVFASSIAPTLVTADLHAQVGPVNGMREADPGPQALVGATVVDRPGSRIERGVVLVRDGRIERVGGPELAVPAGYRIWPCEGLTLYAGLVEPALFIDASSAQSAASTAKGAHWNRRITPQVGGDDLPPVGSDLRESLRAIGFTVAQVLPDRGIVRGVGSITLLTDDTERGTAIDPSSWLVVSAEHGGGGAAGYPGSLMGALALERQTFLDARWYAAARDAWTLHPTGNDPPPDAAALEALLPFAAGAERVLLDGANERDLLRQSRVASELGLDAVFLGSGTEFRRLRQIRELDRPLLIPPRLPRTPDASTPAKAEQLDYTDLLTWELAPTNAARLDAAGVPFAFTTAKLEDRKEFRANVRVAIDHGLSPDAALAGVTTRPAELLGQSASLGTIEAGKLANLVLVDGEIFGTEDKEPGPIRAVWVTGRRHVVEDAPIFALDGRCQILVEGLAPLQAQLDRKEGTLIVARADGTRTSIKPFRIEGDRFGCTIDGELFGREGTLRVGGVAIGGAVEGTAEAADGSIIRFRIESVNAPPLEKEAPPADDEAKAKAEAKAKKDEEEKAKLTAEARAERLALAERPLPFPFGPYGLLELPPQETVLFRNATIWTQGPAGLLAESDVLIRDGLIVEVGRGLATPEGARVIDAAGRHITPGLIDCHSHTGIDGGVNEFMQTNTAECAIADCIDPEDVNWYRQLAGGLTAANQLHGSANPIGGRNSVVKLRWGEDDTRFPIEGAIPGIKFALGENVTRSAGRYPGTRMGVETFIRDAFEAARRHDAARSRWAALPDAERKRTAPPRPDRELDALVEILKGERLIHCHSYRQDEILMLIRLADDLGIRIGTFQHVLEGFKVADEIARHGAGASSFSDWWAYKMEVYDAIPHNGAILAEQGALTSFNSDSNELARHMNTEAAKAVRYGGMDPHEALKFVTINPAKQLRIDHLTGSIEAGKAADLVLWNADPLSVYARVDETWVDGRLRFARVDDARRVEAMRLDRQRLIDRLVAGKGERKPKRDKAESPAPGTEQPKRLGLLDRMLDQSEAIYFELVRRGIDPDDMRPGDCGCGAAAIQSLFGGAR